MLDVLEMLSNNSSEHFELSSNKLMAGSATSQQKLKRSSRIMISLYVGGLCSDQITLLDVIIDI